MPIKNVYTPKTTTFLPDYTVQYSPDFAHQHVKNVGKLDLPDSHNHAISTRDGKAWQGNAGAWQAMSNQAMTDLPDHLTNYMRAVTNAASGIAGKLGAVQRSPATLQKTAEDDFLTQQRRAAQQTVSSHSYHVVKGQTGSRGYVPVDNFMATHVKRQASTVKRSTSNAYAISPVQPGRWEQSMSGSSPLEWLCGQVAKCLSGGGSRSRWGASPPPPYTLVGCCGCCGGGSRSAVARVCLREGRPLS